jgi:hypothetical protein
METKGNHMAIYTRFGSEIEIIDARMIPVWVIHKGHEVIWEYAKPKKPLRHWEVTEQPTWHYRGYYKDNSSPVCDGKWVDANSLKADGGWSEIQKQLLNFAPGAQRKYEEWNKKGAPEASHFFPPARASEIG